ncbi:Transposon Ty3-G Gag-Pol polyprotein [Linum perenne]
MLSFLDMFSGYHQIPLSKQDQEKTAFMTPTANYCYRVMPFGLKNAGATYQRMIDKVFVKQLGRNLEASIRSG